MKAPLFSNPLQNVRQSICASITFQGHFGYYESRYRYFCHLSIITHSTIEKIYGTLQNYCIYVLIERNMDIDMHQLE